jgi:phenylacetate-coenzyme A ligase PaaK-like adenylate-forming protein
MPSDLAPFLSHIETSKKKIPTLRLILTGGEAMPAELKCRFLSALGPTIAFRSTFQTSDAGTLGFQCPDLDEGEYHVHEELQYPEIIRDEDGDDVLVTTNLDRYLIPVVRTKTGDLAQWTNTACRCGRKNRVLRLLGRKSSLLKIGGEKFNANSVNQMASAMNFSRDEFAVRVSRDPTGADVVTICIARNRMNREMHQGAIEILTAGNEKIAKQIADGVVIMKVVELRPEDIQYSITGKKKDIIDQRE